MKTVRTVYQLFFLALFFFLLYVATYDRLAGYPVRLFLDSDPLVALGTVLSTGTLYRALWSSIPILVLTFFLGRAYCGWICPLGTLQDLVAVLRKVKVSRDVEINRYRPIFRRAGRLWRERPA